MIIAIDFDGTIVKWKYPEIGDPVPHAFECLKQLQAKGHYLILMSMRKTELLEQAEEFCRKNGIEFRSVNCCPGQELWTDSKKIHAGAYIDDYAVGCPLVYPEEGYPYVDWPEVMRLLDVWHRKEKRT
jgi:hydroxymethylpyrimidine pyrophosphatase-like HAD family hydrolase